MKTTPQVAPSVDPLGVYREMSIRALMEEGFFASVMYTKNKQIVLFHLPDDTVVRRILPAENERVDVDRYCLTGTPFLTIQ